MIIYIYGADTFRSRQYLREQVEKFKAARDPQGYNVVFLDATKTEVSRILSEIVSSPFLAEKRLIVIENILSSKDEVLLKGLIDKINNKKIPESNVIIFWQGDNLEQDNKRSKKIKAAEELENILLKEKYAQEFALLSEDKLLIWVAQELKKNNTKISHPAAVYLVRNAAGDMWALSGLLQQLLLYARGREISLGDVQLFLNEKVDDNRFNLVEAIAAGDHKKAFKLLQDQKKFSDDTFIFGLIVWQFRLLLQLRSLFENEDNLTSDIAAKILKIHPFVAKKNWAVVKKYPLVKLKEIYSQLLDIDIKTKTGRGNQSMLLDLFIGRN